MYRHCIHCAGKLGANDVLEAFPVGRTVAFDAAKGRLWAVCPKCARWNLAPFEERWEPVEAAEKVFADARLRVQSESIGLARLSDGTRLIRVGAAIPGELAAWRYGDHLVRRQRRFLYASAGAVAIGVGVFAGVAWLGAGGIALRAGWTAAGWLRWRRDRTVIHYTWLSGERERGLEVPLRAWHAPRAVLRSDEDGGLALEVPEARPTDPDGLLKKESVVLDDAETRAFLPRAMVRVNAKGASRGRLVQAVALLEEARGTERFIQRTAARGYTLGERGSARPLPPDHALALEMALHEESERRALAGELTLLQSAWREAEEIAAIADGLALPAD